MGDLTIAKALIEAAADAGVDFVKFQSWRAEKLRKDFPDYAFHYNRHKKTELTDEDHHQLIEWCEEAGVTFLTTCFDLDRVEFLASLGLKTIKVASPDCGSRGLLEKLICYFDHLVISTGMSTEDEILKMMGIVRGHRVTILHCVSEYPTPLHRVNLKRMTWIQEQGFSAGFSDHSLGTEAGRLAIAMGAEILEKHFTLSRKLPGHDQAMSTNPEEFAELVQWTKLAEEMKGDGKHELTPQESELRTIYRGKWGNNR